MKYVSGRKVGVKGGGREDNTEAILKGVLYCYVIIIILMVVGIIAISSAILTSNSTRDDGGMNSAENNIAEDSGDSVVKSEGEGITYDVSKMREVKISSDLVSNTIGRDVVVFIGRESCSWCTMFVPILNEVMDEFYAKVLYVDLDKLASASSDEGRADREIMNGLETTEELVGYMAENFGATPMLLVMRDGKILDARSGYSEFSVISAFFEKNGFDKK